MREETLEFFKGSETESHLKRVQVYTEKLIQFHNQRRSLGLSESYIKAIVGASLMHDIGKAGVPEKILYKEGPLTQNERIIIETHTVIGAYMLEKFAESFLANETKTNFDIARNIVKYHHEKWNGTGYPEQLKGENIPFEARLISIVDIFDALTSKRCYKDSWTVEETLSYIEQEKGEYFDPELTESFLMLEDELEEIVEHYR